MKANKLYRRELQAFRQVSNHMNGRNGKVIEAIIDVSAGILMAVAFIALVLNQ